MNLIKLALVLLLMSQSLLAENIVRGLLLAPGQKVRIHLNEPIESSVQGSGWYSDSFGAIGVGTRTAFQIEASAGHISVDEGLVDQFEFTAPDQEGFVQIIVAKVFDRLEDPDLEMGINIFVVDQSDPANSLFGRIGTYQGIHVEDLNLSSLPIANSTVEGFELETPFTFENRFAFIQAPEAAPKNLVATNFIFPLARNSLSLRPASGQHDPRRDCSRMLPGETFNQYIARCFPSSTGPKPVKTPRPGTVVATDEPAKASGQPKQGSTVSVGTSSSGGHVGGSVNVGYTPPGATGGVGGGVTVSAGETWSDNSHINVTIWTQERTFKRVHRRWNGKNWVVVKVEMCTETVIYYVYPPPINRTEGPVRVGQPVCREVRR